jgi:murein L,D-transpeptidase YafK
MSPNVHTDERLHIGTASRLPQAGYNLAALTLESSMSRNIFALGLAALILWSTTSPRASADAAPETAAPLQASAQLPASAPLQTAAVASTSVDAALPLADRVVVRKGDRKLQLMRNGVALRTFKVALGLRPEGHKQFEGDFRTPEGVYHLTRRNPNSEYFLSIQVDYPNEKDVARARKQGLRPGGAIMIHGQPNIPKKSRDYYSNVDWTEGCIAVSNSDMVEIWLMTPPDTPIEILP